MGKWRRLSPLTWRAVFLLPSREKEDKLVMKWLIIAGLISVQCFACSSCVCVGFLGVIWFSPTDYKQTGNQVGWVWMCVMDCQPIQGEFSYFVPSVTGVDSGSTMTLTRINQLLKKIECFGRCPFVYFNLETMLGVVCVFYKAEKPGIWGGCALCCCHVNSLLHIHENWDVFKKTRIKSH